MLAKPHSQNPGNAELCTVGRCPGRSGPVPPFAGSSVRGKIFASLQMRLFAVCAMLLWWIIPAAAHELRPAIATVDFTTPRTLTVTLSLNLESLIAGIGPDHSDTASAPNADVYNELRSLAPAEIKDRFRNFAPRFLNGLSLIADSQSANLLIESIDVPPVGDTRIARISSLTVSGEFPAIVRAFTWQYDRAFGSVVLRVRDADNQIRAVGWLKEGKVSKPIQRNGVPASDPVTIFLEYVSVGFAHIIPKGLDHILFVVGLFLLSQRWRPLLI